MDFKFVNLTRTDLIRLLAAFLLGGIMGALLLNLIIVRQMDKLIYENKELSNKLENKDNELRKLEESLAHKKWKVVQKLKIIVETEENKHTKQQLESRLYELLKSIIGRQMNEIDGTLLSNNIDDRVIIIEDTNYKIDLIWLLIQEKTIIKVEAVNNNN